MANYILPMTLTPEGQAALMEGPEAVVLTCPEIDIAKVTELGMYAVLGQYAAAAIIDVPDNKSAARYSIQLAAGRQNRRSHRNHASCTRHLCLRASQWASSTTSPRMGPTADRKGRE